VRISLNGSPRELPEGASVSDVVRITGADPEQRGIAVAVESEVVPRSAWEETALTDGQRVEVLQPMQGG
jgi:sulfur carrier protein